MIAPAVHCDNCGRPKGATNHWLQIRSAAKRITIEPLDPASRGVRHVCGEGCLAKMVSAALAGLGATEKPAPDEAIEFPILMTPP